MNPKYWIAVTGCLGAFAVIAGALGAYALTQTEALAVPVRIFDTAQLYHALHVLALFGVAVTLMVTNNQRTAWSGWALQVAALAFTLGVVCFSGGIYRQLASGLTSGGGIVPFGGICFLVGWLATAVAALGFTTDVRERI